MGGLWLCGTKITSHEIMFELFDNEPEDEGKANGVRRN
jgi:hypothetical protein